MDNATAIENAIVRFYSSGDNNIHSWLLQIQLSKEAWNFVWQLLDPAKPGEVQFFGATTLHEKILKQWEEVPDTEYLVLKTKILEILRNPTISKIALSRLCQAFAAFTAKYSVSQGDERTKCMVEELVENLPYSCSNTVGLLLRVLEALPKEFNRPHGIKQIVIRESLMNNWHKTAWLLHQVFLSCETVQSHATDLCILAIECTVSWLRIGQLPVDTIGPLYPYILLSGSHYLPNRDDMGGDCSEGWESVQECLTIVITHNELNKRPQLLWCWAKDLILMVQRHSGKYFYEVLAAFGEAHSRAILIALASDSSEKWIAESLVEFLLQCSEQEGRYPVDEKRSCIPFGFWYVLQDDVASLDEPFNKEAVKALKPIYLRLAHGLLKKSTLPSNDDEAGTADDKELLRCYRQDVADTLIYCYNVLDQDLLIILGQKLSEIGNDPSKWAEVESAIHGFKALCDNANNECQYIPAIMDLIISHIRYEIFPSDVLSTACLAIGDYAEWIGEHPEPWLERSLQLIVQGLTQGPNTASSATVALKDISRECKDSIGPLAGSVLKTISHILPNVIAGGAESLRLMYAAGKLLNTLESTDEQLEHLEATLGLCIMKLRELLQKPVIEVQNAVSGNFKMITMFLTTLEGPIGKAVLEAMLPIFEGVVAHPEWGRHEATVEAMHNCAQKSLSSLPSPDIAKPLLPILNASYKILPHPAGLYFLKQLVLLFGRDPENFLGPVFTEISALTLGGVIVCKQISGNLSEMSDLLQAYFELLAQVCKKCSARLLLQMRDQLPDMFSCGIASLTLPETGTVKAASSFLTHAITQNPHLQTFIQPIGQELVCTIMQCICGLVPPNSLEPQADVLLALNKTCTSEWTVQWLRYAAANFIPSLVSQAIKENFIQDILRERINKRRLFEKIKSFSLHVLHASYVNKDATNFV